MQIKRSNPIHYLILAIVFILPSCKKESAAINQTEINNASINAIRDIVGNKGAIRLINNQQMLHSNASRSTAIDDDTNTRLLTIQEFRKLFQALDQIQYVQIDLDSSRNKKKSSSEYTEDEYDDPGKPGLHKVQFYAFPFSYFNGTYGINQSNLPLAILNLWYETDIHGKVIGTPLLFFTGITLMQTWTQLIVTSIQFNQENYTSNFSIGGTTLYGVNLYGQSIGWTNASRYIISVNMNSNNGEDGKVNVKAEQN